MNCPKCGADNAPVKKCCYRCGTILSGFTINNVTGEYGYRNPDGSFSVINQNTMDAKLQDLAWKCLPKEARDNIRSEYTKTSCLPRKEQYELGVLHTIENTFGFHNLTSDTEPEEMLMVKRKKVQESYQAILSDMRKAVLEELFGDKCLPDKEPMKIDAADSLIIMAKDEMDITEKPIKVGDKVRVVKLYHDGSGHEYMAMTGEVIKVGEKRCRIFNGLIEVSLPYYMLEVIEPYTEENETKRKETQIFRFQINNQLKEKKLWKKKN